jgi:hypothetical protein
MHADRDANLSGVLSFASQARSVLALRTSGFLTSICESNPRPFSSVMPYAFVDSSPTPLIALNATEVHATNVKEYPAVSMQVFPLAPTHISPTQCGLWSLQMRGPVYECAEPDAARTAFLKRFPQAEPHLVDPQFFMFIPEHFSLIGKMLEAPIAITAKAFYDAPVDETARRSRVLIERVNSQHVADLLNLCVLYGEQNPADLESAFVFFIDSLGFDVMAVKRHADVTGKFVVFRMPFDKPQETAELAAESIFNAFVDVSEQLKRRR